MSNRKNQNSILFLTTLGVYLGLLVVGGAAPQVFAHSATTRNFELVDEIEVKDDLDKDPGETNVLAQNATLEKFFEFANAYAEFVLTEYDDEREFSKKIERECPNGCRLSYLRHFPTFTPALEGFFGTSEYSGQISWTGDQIHREMEIKYSPSHSEIFGLQAAFAEVPKPKYDRSAAVSLLREHSVVSINPKNHYLVIVTRLPRAGLDALLAKDAK